MKRIINVNLYDYHNFYPNVYIEFDQKIQKIGPMDQCPQDANNIDAKQGLILPGLINFHTHIYSFLSRGAPFSGSTENFEKILNNIWWKFDKVLKKEDLVLSAKLYGSLSLQAGVTRIIDHHASGLIQGSLTTIREALAQESLLCFETSDRFDLEACIEENKEAGDYFGLHATFSLSEESLARVRQESGDVPIHIHLGESDYDHLEGRGLKRLQDHDLVNKDSIIAHGLRLTRDELGQLKDRQVAIALCERSNQNNGLKRRNYHDLLEVNPLVLVGTDGLGVDIARSWQDVYFQGNQDLQKQGGLSLDQLQLWIQDSYDYASRRFKKSLGRFEPGYQAEFVVFTGPSITPLKKENMMAHLIYGYFDHFAPSQVYLNGEEQLQQEKKSYSGFIDHELVKQLWGRLEDEY